MDGRLAGLGEGEPIQAEARCLGRADEPVAPGTGGEVLETLRAAAQLLLNRFLAAGLGGEHVQAEVQPPLHEARRLGQGVAPALELEAHDQVRGFLQLDQKEVLTQGMGRASGHEQDGRRVGR